MALQENKEGNGQDGRSVYFLRGGPVRLAPSWKR